MSPNNKSLRADNSDVVAYPLTPKSDIQKQLGSLRKENYQIDQYTKRTGPTRLKNLVRVATEKTYEYCGIVVTTNYSVETKNGTKYIDPAVEGKRCYNSSDCVGGRSLRFCNHDYDIFGFCEECSSIETTCATEEFLCENGEKSCNETCMNHVEVNEVATKDVVIPLIVPVTIVVTSLLFLIWIVSRYFPFPRSARRKVEKVHREEAIEDNDFDKEYVLPDWLRKRKEMIFPETSVMKGQQLGKGQFGTVFKGALVQGNAVFPIAIKTSSSNDSKQSALILEEAKNMIQISKYHDHIVNLQGITYTIDKDYKCISSVALLLEYCCKGELRSFLIQHRLEIEKSLTLFMNSGLLQSTKSTSSKKVMLDVKLLHRWVFQIADGMDYLTGKGIYHGDLAARNILLTETLDIKISDFGISRRLYTNIAEPQKLAIKEDEGPVLLPVKWLAFEVLTKYEIVPIKSDVWSFGVTTWEIFSIGRIPYWEGLDVAQLIEGLSIGMRLKTPSLCPKYIGNLIQKCFDVDPDHRPDFKEIKDMLTSYYVSTFMESSESDDGINNLDNIEYLSLQNMASDSSSMQARYYKLLKANKEKQKNEEIATSSIRYSEVLGSETTSSESHVTDRIKISECIDNGL